MPVLSVFIKALKTNNNLYNSLRQSYPQNYFKRLRQNDLGRTISKVPTAKNTLLLLLPYIETLFHLAKFLMGLLHFKLQPLLQLLIYRAGFRESCSLLRVFNSMRKSSLSRISHLLHLSFR